MKRLGQTLSSFMSTLLAHPGRLVITVLVAVGLILSASSFAASKPAPNKKCTAAQQKKTPKKCKPPAKKGAPAQKKNCTAAQQKKTPKKCKPPAKKNCTAAQQKKTPKKCKPPAKKGAPAEPANDNDQEEKAEDEPTADEDTGPEESVEEADPKVPKEVGTSEAADSAADRAADSAADRAADSAADRAADSAADRAADSAADRAADSAADRAADSAADRAPSAAGRADADIPNAPRDSTQEAPAKDQTENDKPAADRSPSNAEGSGDVAQADRTPDAAAYGTAPGGQAEAGNRVAEDQGEPIPVAGSSDDKSDKKPGIWSLVAKIVAGVTVLVGGYFGVRKYYNSRDSSDETSS